MKQRLICSLMLAITAITAPMVSATDAIVQPGQFRHRTAIVMHGPGPYHQLALPLTVYQGVERDDLGDMRVFNGKGETVPHALLRSTADTVSTVNEKPVPVFPILASRDRTGERDALAIDLRKNADGTLVSIRQAPAGRGTTEVRGVVADVSKLGKGVRSLRLTVGPTGTPFHGYSVETSDDLQQWRMLVDDVQLVRLEHDGQRVEKNSVEWHTDAGKYLRIVWDEPHAAPVITAVAAGISRTETSQAPMVWSAPYSPVRMERTAYEYALPGRMPLGQLRINLPQANTLAPLQVQHYVSHHSRRRERERGDWQTLANTVAFRLQSAQGEVRSADIVLQRQPENRLRLVVDARSGGLGNAAPTLQVGFAPHILVFLPRGEGPFTLAWGAAQVNEAALPVSTLMPGYAGDKKLAASPATLAPIAQAPAAASAAAPAPQGASKAVLWGVLIAGVLVLAGMVWMLSRQIKPGATPQE